MQATSPAASITGGSSIDTTNGGTLANTLAVTVADSASRLTLGTTDVIGSLTNAGRVDTNAAIGFTGGITNTGTLNVNYVDPNPSLDNASLLVAGSVANNGGTINLASGTVTGLRGNVTNSGTVNNNAGSLVVLGTLTNQAAGVVNLQAGAVTTLAALTNSGTINANDALTVSGAYVQTAGTLTTNSALNTGSLSGAGGTITLNNNAVYTINQTVAGTYNGAITGSGTVNKTGAAALTLHGAANSFRPSQLNIVAGTLGVDGAGILNNALNVNISTGATLSLITGDQTIHDLTGTGIVALATNNLILADGGTFAGTVTGSGNVRVLNGNFTLSNTINSTNGNFVVSPTTTMMTVGSTGTLNTATLSVSGPMNVLGTVNTTSTAVAGSTLHLGNSNGTSGGVLNSGTTVVNNGGQLTGVGSITGSTTIGGTGGGTVAPGNSPGVLTFANLTFGASGNAQMQVDGVAGAGVTGGYDQIVVSGTLSLQAGSLLNIQKTSTFEPALGQAVRLFAFTPGAVSGNFGSVTKTGFTNDLIFNIATGEAIGLGSYSTSAFTQAVSTTPNQSALVKQLMVNNAGGVNQYYGGMLMNYVTTALGQSAAAVKTAFDRWSPEAYTGIVDHMRDSMLANLPELGGYDKLEASRWVAIGSFNRSGSHTKTVAGYVKNTLRDTGFNIGFAHQFGAAQLQLTYGHTDGDIASTFQTNQSHGDQIGVGASVPFALNGKLRATARYVYGAYSVSGDRYTNSGKVSIDNVKSNTDLYGLGLEYLYTNKAWRIDSTLEFLGMNQHVNGFSEAAGSAAQLDTMSVLQQRRNVSLLKADMNIGYSVSKNAALYLKLGVVEDLNYNMHDLTARVRLENVNFTIQNPGLERTRATSNLGARVKIGDGLMINVDGGAGTDGSFNFNGGLRYTF